MSWHGPAWQYWSCLAFFSFCLAINVGAPLVFSIAAIRKWRWPE